MQADPALVRCWSVGEYRCTLTIPRFKRGQQVQVSIEWSPRLPGDLTPDELEEYRRGRDKAVCELVSELGIAALLVEL